jgi:hypothetical protein
MRRNAMSGSDNNRPRIPLASRRHAGICVTLLWAAETNTVAVVVRDDATHAQFELPVETQTNPMEVYDHPYAYAARRGIDYDTTFRGQQAGRGHAPLEERRAA